MSGRDQLIRAEATALWRELYGEPPPAQAEGGEILETILRRLPDAPYERIASPHLRSSAVSHPRRHGRAL